MKKNTDIDEAALDEALAKIQALEPSSGLIDRIMTDARDTLDPKAKPIFWPFGKIWQPLTVMVVATLLGVWFGIDAIRVDNADVMNEIEMMLMG